MYAFLCFLLVAATTSHAVHDFDVHRITIGSEPDYPPYCFTDEEGKPVGFSLDLFQAAAGVMGLKVDVRVDLWAKLKRDLAEGRLDALPLVGRTPEREEMFDFTFPYLSLYGGIVVRKNTRDIKDFEDLDGKVVAVMKGENAEEFLRRAPRDFQIITTDTFLDALELLEGGLCDAVVIQRLVGYRLIREEGFTTLKVLDEPITEFRQDFCFAVQEGHKELLAILNEGLALVMADGTFRRLQTKWFASLDLPSRRLIVGGDRNYPPFEFLDKNGEPSGYNVDLTRAIARELDLDIEIRLGEWAHMVDMLERGEIDVLQGMLYSSNREKLFDFSQAHTVNHYVLVSRSDNIPLPETVEELRGKPVVVQEGDIMHDFALEHGLQDTLITVPDQEKAMSLVSEGVFDYAVAGRLTAFYLIEKNGWKNLVLGKQPLLSPEYSFAVKNGQRELLSHFSEGLAIIEESGEYRKIYDDWLGVYEPLPPSFWDVFRYILFIIAPLLFALMIFFLWTRSLRRQVARRTTELQKSEEKYRLLAENASDLISVFNLEKKEYTYVSPSIEKLIGYTAGEILAPGGGRPAEQEAARKALDGALRTIPAEDGEPTRVQFRLGRKDGTGVWLESYLSLIRDDDERPVSILGITRDISLRKKSEDELRALKDELEQKVIDRTRELNEKVEKLDKSQKAMLYMVEDLNDVTRELKEQRRELEAANRELESFSYSVSHDLRAPLRAIDGFSRIIEEDYVFHLDAEGKRLFGVIRENIFRMDELISNLLEYSRTGRQEIHPSHIDMSSIAESIYREVASPEVLSSFRFSVADLPRAYADSTLIRRVWSNLLTNAIKYTLPKDDRVIEINGWTENETKVYTIRDSGVGFDSEYKEKLFGVFQRLHSSSEFEGTGVGLAIVQRIVHRHGGEVWAEGKEQEGAVFYFTLPERHMERKE